MAAFPEPLFSNASTISSAMIEVPSSIFPERNVPQHNGSRLNSCGTGIHAFRHLSTGLLAAMSLTSSTLMADPARGYPIQAPPVTAVELADGFWHDRILTNLKVTVPHVIRQCETTGRIDNFSRAAGLLDGEYTGFHFNDSDVYKLVEGISSHLAVRPDPSLRQTLDSIVSRIAAAQQADGYLHPYITLKEPAARWRDPHRHELFSIGHLIEAGAVHFKMTGGRDLLNVAIRAADRVAADFKPETGPLHRPPEHQQIEIGLVRLFEATGEAKYLDLSKRFIEARGRPLGRQLMGEYCQDHQPVAEQRAAVGHAVRALYQYSSMADHAAYSGDAGYRTALEALWQDVFGKKAYLTGGVGASGGNEGFGAAYDLPNATAYSETCASIGSIMWNERMFRLTGEGRFMDLVERTLFNALLSGVSLEGNRFFYPNRLESFRGTERSEWFDCACCPSNVVRFLPTIPSLAYAQSAGKIYVNQFINSRVSLQLDGHTVTLRQVSDYPWNGMIRIEVNPSQAARFSLMLRLPGWARGEVMAGGLYQMMDSANPPVGLTINGAGCDWQEQSGYARIDRDWQPGDIVELDLPMPVRRILARAEVNTNEERVAFQRGPVVYCAEGTDQVGGAVMDLMIEDSAAVQPGYRKDLLHGQHVITGKARQVSRNEEGSPQAGETVEFLGIPYFAWAHRGGTPMQVWLARTPAAARPAPRPTIASTSVVRTSNGASGAAINDQLEPRGSEDQSLPFFHWWPKLGTTEWIDYEFPRAATITSAEVYWFDDSNRGGACRIPKSWRLLRREGDIWKPVETREVHTLGKDRWSRVSFQPVTTTALRLEVGLPDGFSAGVHEWKLEETAPSLERK